MSLNDILDEIKKSDLQNGDLVLFNNIKQILESKDNNLIKKLYALVKIKCEKHILNNTSFDTESTKCIHAFWNNYYTCMLKDSNKTYFEH